MTLPPERAEEIARLEAELDDLRVKLRERDELLKTVMVERGRVLLYQIERASELSSQAARAEQLDPVTEVFRHGYFRMRLVFEAERSRRTRQPLGLLLVDLDRFAELNEAFGYDQGERALARVGRGLAGLWLSHETARPPVLGREAGDCFGVLLPAADAAEVAERAEEARNLIDRLPMSPRRLTASVGASVVTDPERADPRALLDAARAALDRAKSRGGNCVEVEQAQSGARNDPTG